MSIKYNSKIIENKIYDFWMNKNYFYSEPNDKKSYTIVMPPPNVTGMLHIGHILNNTIQDVLVRIKRMKGYNVCWIPGTDHASIATEVKIISELKKKGLSKYNFEREKFLNITWDWVNKYNNIILTQLKKIGCSCDWQRFKFTMDKDLSESVTKIFIDLYNRGLIYRDYKIVNWDTVSRTTISDEEILYKNYSGKLYYIKYKIKGTEEFINIATTRPETIFGDSAICINPNDNRYNHLKNKKAIIPIVNRIIPIIEDEYVDINFGTGCIKVTPSHDFNDKKLGDKHNLIFINILNEDGTLNEKCLHYNGKDRFQVKKEIIKELKEIGSLIKEENYLYKIGLSERTKTIVEPKLSLQWFLKMNEMIDPALKYVIKDKIINFYPKKIKNIYYNWIKNIRDWNISRQLWWGHRMPVYYYGNNKEEFVVAKNIESALEIIKNKTKNFNINKEDIKQDKNVLDTWFSSWIWPITVFDGIRNPKNNEFLYYYPTKDLISGPDILFFWVARMIMAGHIFINKEPFKNVYFTGIIRDNKRRKMSKSLGNSPNINDLIDKYGADGIRIGILINTKYGNDFIFNENICLQGRNFANKIWNAFILIMNWKIDNNIECSKSDKIAIQWIENRFYQVLNELEKYYNLYKISESIILLYKFIWDDFCSYYLEIIKPYYNKNISPIVLKNTIKWFENILKILHPYMPFITEEIWQKMKPRSSKEALIVTSWPKKKIFDKNFIKNFSESKNIISNIRAIKKYNNIDYKQKIFLYVVLNSKNSFFDPIILKLAYISKIIYFESKPKKNFFSFIINNNEFFIEKNNMNKNKLLYNNNIVKEKLQNDLNYQNNFLLKIRKNLSNIKFMSLAPKTIIIAEQKKEQDIIKKILYIKEQLNKL